MKNIGEKSRPRRVSLNLPVTYDNLGIFLDSEIMNLSKGGVFIKADISLPLRSKVDFQFTLPDDEKVIKATGMVVWSRKRNSRSDEPSGMGVQFLEISTADIELILDHIEKLLKNGE